MMSELLWKIENCWPDSVKKGLAEREVGKKSHSFMKVSTRGNIIFYGCVGIAVGGYLIPQEGSICHLYDQWGYWNHDHVGEYCDE